VLRAGWIVFSLQEHVEIRGLEGFVGFSLLFWLELWVLICVDSVAGGEKGRGVLGGGEK
jgi:hypothetical protein